MGAAVALRNVVGEAKYAFVVAVVPPQRALYCDAFALRLDHDRSWDERGLVAVEEFHEGFDAALVFHLLALLDRVALVGEDDGNAGIQERQLTQSVLKSREVKLHHRESLRRGQERHFGPALALRIAGCFERSFRNAVVEFHEMRLAVAPDGELQPS